MADLPEVQSSPVIITVIVEPFCWYYLVSTTPAGYDKVPCCLSLEETEVLWKVATGRNETMCQTFKAIQDGRVLESCMASLPPDEAALLASAARALWVNWPPYCAGWGC